MSMCTCPRTLATTVVAAALATAACKDGKPPSGAGAAKVAEPAVAAAPVAAAGRVIRLTPVATWGGVEVTPEPAGADDAVDTYRVTFALAPQAPVTVRVPRGDRLELAPLPALAAAAPLDAAAYELTLLPDQRAPTGFRFATRPSDTVEPFELAITRAAEPDAYQIAGTIAGNELEGTLRGVTRCEDAALSGVAPDLGLGPSGLAAAAALGRELDAHLARIEGGRGVLQVLVMALGRRLVDVERLSAHVAAPPCGQASLELVCAEDTCRLDQLGQPLTLARGDALTMGTGTTTTFAAVAR